MGLFYTGKGDEGESLVGKVKIDKGGIEIEALGDLDELNSLIGLVRTLDMGEEFKIILKDIQEALFIVQANLAEFMMEGTKAPELKIHRIREMEQLISKFEEEVNPNRNFVISGEDSVSAWLDYSRAVSRRSERSIVKFSKIRSVSPEILSYMNRLSSILFSMARLRAKRIGSKEDKPNY